jgi:hypothetical protein
MTKKTLRKEIEVNQAAFLLAAANLRDSLQRASDVARQGHIGEVYTVITKIDNAAYFVRDYSSEGL